MDERYKDDVLEWMQLARTTLETLRETVIMMDQRQRSLAASRRLTQAEQDLQAMRRIEQRARKHHTPPQP